MPRKPNPFPKYERYKGDSARIRFRGREYHLGKYDSPESRAEYRSLCAEFAASPAAAVKPGGALLSEVVTAFMTHARSHYRTPDGKPTSEFREHVHSTKHAVALYGHAAAREFGPLAFQAVRKAMVAAGWCRSVVNKRAGRLRACSAGRSVRNWSPSKWSRRWSACRGCRSTAPRPRRRTP